jgi:hypothetical protein
MIICLTQSFSICPKGDSWILAWLYVVLVSLILLYLTGLIWTPDYSKQQVISNLFSSFLMVLRFPISVKLTTLRKYWYWFNFKTVILVLVYLLHLLSKQDNNIGICFFSTKYAASRSNTCMLRIRIMCLSGATYLPVVSEWSNISTCRLLFQWSSTMKFWSSTEQSSSSSHGKKMCTLHETTMSLSLFSLKC